MDSSHHESLKILEGIFAIDKPASITSAAALTHLQATFHHSNTFAPLLQHQSQRPSKAEASVFKIGHAGTLDPLASGVLVIGIGRGTKALQRYLACSKTYETIVVFGVDTDSYDITGRVVEVLGSSKPERTSVAHVTREVVERKLEKEGCFRGKVVQVPPVVSALKVGGKKALEYVKDGVEMPRELEGREVEIEECDLLEWYDEYDAGECLTGIAENDREGKEAKVRVKGPAARIRLTVSSGFYVRSFAHDLGIACGTHALMAALHRIRQADFCSTCSTSRRVDSEGTIAAITFEELDAGEDVWGAKLKPQLEAWVKEHPLPSGHVDGRDEETKRKLRGEREGRPRQRFRGEWVAESKQERIRQQGGKWKGKWNKGKKGASSTSIDSHNM